MADYHRVHPVIAGSPLPPPEEKAAKDDKSSNHDQQLQITAPRPDAPAPLRPPRRRRRQRGRCCRCLCWTLLALLFLAIALGATAGILYAIFKPQIPKFSVDRLTATKFDVNTTSMVVTDAFEVQVTAENPNRRIGVYYVDGGMVSAAFNGTELCRGAFPALYQGHRSTVRPLITLQGETRLDSEVASQLLAAQQQAGVVPLTVTARVPIRIKFGGVKLWKMTGKARCSLVVDSIRPGTPLRIRSNSCSFKLKI